MPDSDHPSLINGYNLLSNGIEWWEQVIMASPVSVVHNENKWVNK